MEARQKQLIEMLAAVDPVVYLEVGRTINSLKNMQNIRFFVVSKLAQKGSDFQDYAMNTLVVLFILLFIIIY